MLIRIIKLYQKTPNSFHGYCKFVPSCSDYMIDSLNEYGLIKGLFFGIKRLFKCNPMSKGGYDPVRKKGK